MTEVATTDQVATKDPRLEVAFPSAWKDANDRRQMVEALKLDIATKKGKAEAVTLCANLRKVIKPISEAHTKAKAVSKAFGELLDNEKNMLIDMERGTIAIYADPLQKQKDDEAARVAAIQARIEAMNVGPDIAARPSVEILAKRDEIAGVIIGDDFQEFAEAAQIVKVAAIACLDEAAGVAVKREADARELEAGRKKLAEQAEQIRASAAAEAARVKATQEAAGKVKAAEDAAKAATERAEKAEKAAEEPAPTYQAGGPRESASFLTEQIKNAQDAKAREGNSEPLFSSPESISAAAERNADKREAMLDEIGGYLGEAEALALYNGIASGNITTLVMA